MSRGRGIIRALAMLAAMSGGARGDEASVDLTGAVVVAPPGTEGPRAEAVRMLVEEVEVRSRVRWARAKAWPDGPTPVIAVGTAPGLEPLARAAGLELPGPASGKPEGYRLEARMAGGRPTIWVVGDDDRGVLFGVGRLLRTLRMRRDRIALPDGVKIVTSPRYPIRGHQLGYRPKTNSYDGWTVAQWEQYYRDLILFGCNAIELIPPRSDDDADSPHFPVPPLTMMREMSRLADRYGLDVWIWYPALDKDYNDPETVRFALEEWGRVFRELPRVDAVFVPGGDPGATPPGPLFALLERQTANLRKFHPKATMWLSPQGFDKAGTDEFLRLVRAGPDWLAGLVYGPQVRLDLPALRTAVPSRYPIRFYPDITHSRTCQYPVPNWDRAFALTEAREVINPRPVDQTAIFRRYGPLTDGFITYSEGCNDDVNKAVWSARGWDSSDDLVEVLRDFGRVFLGPDLADPFAQGLLALERNWRGPAATNADIETTLAQFRSMERAATPQVKANWRFQQALYRAYYDAYIRRRLIEETAQEGRALDALRQAGATGSRAALDRAEHELLRAAEEPVAPDLRARTSELAEALFQSIRMQLSVPRYGAIALGRGTSQDTIDAPLNDRVWLLEQIAAIRALPAEPERLARIDAVVDRTNPGPGGFYDDLGSTARQPHLMSWSGFADDPARRSAVLMHFVDDGGGPAAWRDQALTLYEQPLRMEYRDLDPRARYAVRVVYGLGPVRLVADARFEVHPPEARRYEPLEFPVPPEATADGTLHLDFHGQAGRGSNGRSVSVAEVWLIRVAP